MAPEAIARLPAVVYFHENQLTYPVREERERDLHFAFTNLITAHTADAVWFNSRFHRDDFLSAAEAFARRLPDYQPVEMIEAIRAKSSVQWPGIESFDPSTQRPNGPLHIVWAARWEHDKNPEDFFAALDQLEASGIDFRVSVLGESFREVPPVFAEYHAKLADRIVHWGYQESRAASAAALQSADVFVSTARHEFFGLAAAEAMAAGCFPLLPWRLAYPELVTEAGGAIREEFLYDGTIEGLTQRLKSLSKQKQAGGKVASVTKLSARFDWQVRAPELDIALSDTEAARNIK
jgi:glycosyltransferase involved in cell wall biosynthesis